MHTVSRWLLLGAAVMFCTTAAAENLFLDNLPVKIMSGGTGGIDATQANPGSDATKAVAVQGVTGGKAVKVDGSAVTQPVSAAQATASNLNAQVVGTVASGATDSGNPVKAGGKYNSTLPTLTDGQRGDLQLGSNGAMIINPSTSISADGASGGSAAFNVPGGTAARVFGVAPWQFNGSTNDRAFTCPNQAVINITAGNTTQLVALASTQVIRICGFSVVMSATGTFKFVYGTGSNCATGTADMTGAAPLTGGTPWTASSGNGSVLRTAASNALCGVAATGNGVGYVSYAQY